MHIINSHICTENLNATDGKDRTLNITPSMFCYENQISIYQKKKLSLYVIDISAFCLLIM